MQHTPEQQDTFLDTTARINAFVALGERINQALAHEANPQSPFEEALHTAITRAQHFNAWFTPHQVKLALQGIAHMLQPAQLQQWLAPYMPALEENKEAKTVGVVMAGNIPMVGFHDLLCVLMAGHTLHARQSTSDNVLLPLLVQALTDINPTLGARISFVERINEVEAVIATGSNNTARYFEFYFRSKPHIIRMNRTAVAVLTGHETHEQLVALGHDLFTYFGLGCRNVSKLYVPEGYDFNPFWNAMQTFDWLLTHNKYANNHDYYSALLLLKRVPFLSNNMLIIKEDADISTPVAVLNYSYYTDKEALAAELSTLQDRIQCVVGDGGVVAGAVPFGRAQQPDVWDYADGVDTMAFLLGLE